MTDFVQQALDSISDRTDIDWTALEARSTGDETQVIVQCLRDISSIVRAHSVCDAQVARSVPFEWGSLQVQECIAHGVHGDVYRAWDPRLERAVALKLLYGDTGLTNDPMPVMAEGRLLARVRHPNVVTVYGADRMDGQSGIWMEFLRGRTLREEVAHTGPLPAAAAIRAGLEICGGLAAVHAAGLIHRDVKAQNVMRTVDGRTILMDLGAAQDDAGAERGLEGTPLYLAPELLAGGTASVKSEIYALGVLLFFMLTGRYPLTATSLDELRRRHSAGESERLAVSRRIPSAVSAVVDRAVAVNPADRFESVDALSAALQQSIARPWRRGWQAALGLSVLLIGLLAFWARPAAGPRVAFQQRDWALVADFENKTGEPRLDGVLERALAYELSQSTYVNVAPRERIDDALRLMARPATTVVDTEVAREVARRDSSIHAVVSGAIERLGERYSMTVRVVDPGTGAVVAARREEATSPAQVSSAVRRLSNWIRVTLGEAPLTVGRDTEHLEKVTSPSLRAVSLYSQAQNAAQAGHWGTSEALLASALAEDPQFASAHIWMAWTLQNLGRPAREVLAAAQRAVDLVPRVTDRERYFILGSHHLLTQESEQALGQFEALVQRYPDDAWGLRKLLNVYGETGRPNEGANVAMRIADTRPNDFYSAAAAAQRLLEWRSLEAARPYVTRARELLERGSRDSVYPGGQASWVLLFPVHDLWVQGRAKEAARLLDGTLQREEIAADGTFGLMFVGGLNLVLGRVGLAHEAYSRIHDESVRGNYLTHAALARADRDAMLAGVRAFKGGDLAPVSVLIQFGEFNAAERLLSRLSGLPRRHMDWAVAELDEARGDHARIEEAVAAGAPWTRAMNGVRAFLYSETLARAANAIGDRSGAIRVLEESETLSTRTFTRGGHSGYFWLRSHLLLADLYREAGRETEARGIEDDLRRRLEAADADFPLLIELERRIARR